MNKIVFIGAGNLATRLSIALQQCGCEILQIYSRTEESAVALSKKLNVPYTTFLDKINSEAEIYIFSVNDYAIRDCAIKIKKRESLFVHTSGSVPLSVFDGISIRSGVLYPLQTFSKEKNIDFEKVPFFIESNNRKDEQLLCNLSRMISQNVHVLSSEKRQYLHLSAVFACNFVNHIYDLSAQILQEQSLSFEYLIPLIEETAEKVKTLSPHDSQTGPAVRYDVPTIRKHIRLLTDEKNKKLYNLLTQSIFNNFNKKKI